MIGLTRYLDVHKYSGRICRRFPRGDIAHLYAASFATLWVSDQAHPWDSGEGIQDHRPATIVLVCSVVEFAFPPTLSFANRPGQPALENVALATTDANGGEYDLISSIVIGRGYYSGIKEGDTDYLGGRRYLPEAGLSKSLLHQVQRYLPAF